MNRKITLFALAGEVRRLAAPADWRRDAVGRRRCGEEAVAATAGRSGPRPVKPPPASQRNSRRVRPQKFWVGEFIDYSSSAVRVSWSTRPILCRIRSNNVFFDFTERRENKSLRQSVNLIATRTFPGRFNVAMFQIRRIRSQSCTEHWTGFAVIADDDHVTCVDLLVIIIGNHDHRCVGGSTTNR